MFNRAVQRFDRTIAWLFPERPVLTSFALSSLRCNVDHSKVILLTVLGTNRLSSSHSLLERLPHSRSIGQIWNDDSFEVTTEDPDLILHNAAADFFFTTKIFIEVLCRMTRTDQIRSASYSFYDDASLTAIDFEIASDKEKPRCWITRN